MNAVPALILGVIPARGGSKRLPGKNLLPLEGIPLIGWTIRAAKESRLLTQIWVSTDDPAIAAKASELGCEVPFTRPAEFSGDDAASAAVLRHAVRWHLDNLGKAPEIVVLLQPTSPLRRAQEIDDCIKLVVEGGADSAQTVTEDTTHPWHRFLLKDGRLTPLHPDAASRRERLYRPTGSVYAVRTSVAMAGDSLRGPDHRGLVCPFETSVDIDEERDLRLAELLLREAARAK